MHLQWLSSVFGCFASVLDVCHKCLKCCGRMLQVFHLDIAHVAMEPPTAIAHLLQLLRRRRAGAKYPRLHTCGKRTRHERSPRVVGRVGGACSSSGVGPAWAHLGAGTGVWMRVGPRRLTRGG
jgi:hypothetical protein